MLPSPQQVSPPLPDLATPTTPVAPPSIQSINPLATIDPSIPDLSTLGGYLEPYPRIHDLSDLDDPYWSKLYQKVLLLFDSKAESAVVEYVSELMACLIKRLPSIRALYPAIAWSKRGVDEIKVVDMSNWRHNAQQRAVIVQMDAVAAQSQQDASSQSGLEQPRQDDQSRADSGQSGGMGKRAGASDGDALSHSSSMRKRARSGPSSLVMSDAEGSLDVPSEQMGSGVPSASGSAARGVRVPDGMILAEILVEKSTGEGLFGSAVATKATTIANSSDQPQQPLEIESETPRTASSADVPLTQPVALLPKRIVSDPTNKPSAASRQAGPSRIQPAASTSTAHNMPAPPRRSSRLAQISSDSSNNMPPPPNPPNNIRSDVSNYTRFMKPSLVVEEKPKSTTQESLDCQLAVYLLTSFSVCGTWMGLMVRGERFSRMICLTKDLLVLEVSKDYLESIEDKNPLRPVGKWPEFLESIQVPIYDFHSVMKVEAPECPHMIAESQGFDVNGPIIVYNDSIITLIRYIQSAIDLLKPLPSDKPLYRSTEPSEDDLCGILAGWIEKLGLHFGEADDKYMAKVLRPDKKVKSGQTSRGGSKIGGSALKGSKSSQSRSGTSGKGKEVDNGEKVGKQRSVGMGVSGDLPQDTITHPVHDLSSLDNMSEGMSLEAKLRYWNTPREPLIRPIGPVDWEHEDCSPDCDTCDPSTILSRFWPNLGVSLVSVSEMDQLVDLVGRVRSGSKKEEDASMSAATSRDGIRPGGVVGPPPRTARWRTEPAL